MKVAEIPNSLQMAVNIGLKMMDETGCDGFLYPLGKAGHLKFTLICEPLEEGPTTSFTGPEEEDDLVSVLVDPLNWKAQNETN